MVSPSPALPVSWSPRPRVLALLIALIAAISLPPPAVRSASALLDAVKQNPALARQMCAGFRRLNAGGQSATSSESIASVASGEGLSAMDAEVLITYVMGLYCSDVY